MFNLYSSKKFTSKKIVAKYIIIDDDHMFVLLTAARDILMEPMEPGIFDVLGNTMLLICVADAERAAVAYSASIPRPTLLLLAAGSNEVAHDGRLPFGSTASSARLELPLVRSAVLTSK